jgi:competence protein ComEA
VSELSRGQIVVYVAGAVALVLIAMRYLHRETPPSGNGGARPVPVRVTDAGGRGRWAVVQVAGEVRRPGVYTLPAGDRVNDALARAGGPTPRADLAGVNLAAKVEDGRQVIVPARGASGASGPGGGASPAAGGGGQLNLNTATPEQLDELDGVGPETARRIVAYRQEHGGFRSVAELDQVPGIGPKRLAALRQRLRV